jgi:amino acid transporter
MSLETSQSDDQAIIDAGYKPVLHRGLGFFSSFAISFSYMSVLTGIFANYGYVLTKAGPFGYWTWILVALGHTLTALVFAEMAGRMPLTGCGYNWNNKLVNPTVGWFAGWMALFAYAVGVAAVTATLFPALHSLLGVELDTSTTRYVGIGLVLLQAIINIYGVRIAAYINLLAVGAEILAIIVFGSLIGGALLIHGHVDFAALTTIPSTPQPYLPAFMMACLLGSWTLLGFEGAADVSEETIDAARVAPKGIIRSIVVCSLLGLFFIIVMTLAIPDLAVTTSASDPVTAIVASALGDGMSKVFLVLVLVSIFACSLVNMTGASRVLFAMARDKRFVASNVFQKVSAHHVPLAAIWLVTIVAAFFLWIADSATALYGAGAVLFALFYLTTVLGFAVGSKKLPTAIGFSLGRWHWPVIVLSVLWLILEIGILTVPAEFHSVAIATGGVLIAGVVLYFISGRVRHSSRC